MFPRTFYHYQLVVNFDSNNNFTTIFDQFKNSKGISQDIKEFERKINVLKNANATNGMQVNSLLKQYQHLGDSVLNAGRSFLKGTTELDDFTRACEGAIPTTAKFTTALKDIGANLAVSAVISLVMSAISGLATAIETWSKTNFFRFALYLHLCVM